MGISNCHGQLKSKSYLQLVVDTFAQKASRLAQWLEMAVPESLTGSDFLKKHHRRIRTTDFPERLNEDLKRRTHVARIYANPDSCLRLVSALLMETDKDW